jgi:hypothetical protein
MGSTSVTCGHPDREKPYRRCGGELEFSHDIADEDRTSVYYCKVCGRRTDVT